MVTTLPSAGGQEVQQVEFLPAQSEVPVRERRLTRRCIDPKRADGDGERVRVLFRPAQDSAQTRLELPGRERLDDVVVGPRVESADDLGFVVSGSDDDDRDIAHGPQHAEQVDTVDIGQPEVQQDDVGMLVDDDRQSRRGRSAAVLTS